MISLLVCCCSSLIFGFFFFDAGVLNICNNVPKKNIYFELSNKTRRRQKKQKKTHQPTMPRSYSSGFDAHTFIALWGENIYIFRLLCLVFKLQAN